jgi:hypothetical protein
VTRPIGRDLRHSAASVGIEKDMRTVRGKTGVSSWNTSLILYKQTPKRRSLIKGWLNDSKRACSIDFATLCSLYCAGPALVWAQSQSTPPAAFKVASVKPLEQSLPPGQYDLSFVGTSGSRSRSRETVLR